MSSATKARIRSMVERSLLSGKVGSAPLHERAKSIDNSFKTMGPQAFHASYYLPVVRNLLASGAIKPRPRKTARRKEASSNGVRSTTSNHTSPDTRGSANTSGAVREVLLKLVRDSLASETRASVVGLMEGLDARVAAVLAAARKG